MFPQQMGIIHAIQVYGHHSRHNVQYACVRERESINVCAAFLYPCSIREDVRVTLYLETRCLITFNLSVVDIFLSVLTISLFQRELLTCFTDSHILTTG